LLELSPEENQGALWWHATMVAVLSPLMMNSVSDWEVLVSDARI